MKGKAAITAGMLIFTGSFFANTVFAEKINTPITGWQASFWNMPEGEGLSGDDGGVEITIDPEWVFDGSGALHVWTNQSLPDFNAQAVQEIEFEQDEDYRLTGNIYISSTSWGFGLYIGSDRLDMLRNLVTAGEWSDVDYTFTYTGSSSEFKLQTAQAGDLYADNLSLKKVIYNEDGSVLGYGEELLKNGDFESDFQSAGEVTELTAESINQGAILSWRNPDDERLGSIIILKDGDVIKTVGASEESVEIDGLENGTAYTFTVKTQTVTGILSEGTEITVTPYRTIAIPKILKDDKENRIIGITEDMEYSIDAEQSWTQYDTSQPPDLSGNLTVWVRYADDTPGVIAPAQVLCFTANDTNDRQIQISKIRFEGNEFILEGKLNREEPAAVTVYVIRQGEDRRSLKSVLTLGQTTSEEDGSFSFRKPVAEQRNGIETDGFYNVYIDSTVTDEVKYEGIAFASSKNIESAIEALFTQSNTAELLEKDSIYYNTYLAMGMTLDEYHEHTNIKSAIVSDFKDLLSKLDKDDENIVHNVSGAFAKAYVINALKSADAETAYFMLKERLEYMELSYDDIDIAAVIGADDARTAFVTEYLAGKTYNSYEDLNQGFAEGIALHEINGATYGILPEILKKHSEALNLNSTYYNEYASLSDGSDKKITASKKIVDIKSSQPFTDIDALLDAVRRAMNSAGSSNTGGSGGSGGGNSSGTGAGGGSGFYISVPLESQNTSDPTSAKNQQESEGIFNDLNSAQWAEESIEYLYRYGYISGYDDGSFRPNQPITREEFVTILVNAFDLRDDTAECGFEDVPHEAWYYESVASAVKAGLVYGIDENRFGAGQNINREALATLVYRCLSRLNVNVENNGVSEFKDKDSISEYAVEAVGTLSGMGIINGYEDGSFLPRNTATRAEACKILYGILTMED